eukprot:8754971-Ditylum_brightwellii.AAC.1
MADRGTSCERRDDALFAITILMLFDDDNITKRMKITFAFILLFPCCDGESAFFLQSLIGTFTLGERTDQDDFVV